MRYIVIFYFFSYLSIIGFAQNTNNIKSNVDNAKIKINNENLIIEIIGQNGLPAPQKVLAGNPSIKKYNNSSIIVGISNLSQTEKNTNSKKKAIKSCLPSKKFIKRTKQTEIIPEIIKIKNNNKRKHVILYPKPTEALNPQYKDNSTYNIQYLDVEQGMPSSYIQSIFIDSRENIWLGTYEAGVSVYNGENVVSFTKNEGLPNNGILSIVEDSNNNIWFGTDGGGICKYDGNSFTNYTEKDGLLNNSVLSLVIDTKGQLWCGTNGGGISCFDGKVFRNYMKDNGLPNNTINSILEDKDGNMWFSTDGSGILIFDGNIFYNLTIKDGLPSNIILSIIQDTQGNIWFSTKENGLCKLIVHEKSNYIIEHFTKEQGLSSNAIKSIFQDESGNIWIGTKDAGINKLFQTNINNKKRYVIDNFSEKNGMSGNDISSIKEDNNNNIWVGTYGGGVCKIKPNSFIHYTNNEGLANNIVRSITEDSNGNMWFGTNGGGVDIFDGTYFKQLTKDEGLINNYVNCVVEDNKGNFWLGTKEGLCKYDGKYFTYFTKDDYLLDNTIWSLFNDSKGNIWIGTRHGGVSKFDGKSFTHFTKQNGLKNNTVWSITEDSKGNLWFGTYGDGVCKYDGEYFTYFSNAKGISKTSVWGILEDSQKRLWFGTNNGVYIYDGKTFENYTKKQGLSNNTTWSIIEDKNNNIWIATENGLNLLENIAHINNIKLFKNKIYTKQDGLKGLDFYSEAVFIDSKNNIWWGSGKSLTRLNLNNFKTNIDTPSISLNSININQEFIDFRNLLDDTSLIIEDLKNDIKFNDIEAFNNYPNNLELAYYLNNITFNFSAINWQAPHKIRYSYKLEGLDKTWSIASKENKAEYRNIPYGKYTFKVRAIRDSKIWGNTFKYSFVITPPWWQSLFAKFIYIGLSILFIILLIKWRTSKLKKEQKKLEDTVKERTIEISKINNELIDINNAKNRFFSIFSHDIKNPFGTLVSLTDYIDKSYFELDDKVRKEITKTINKSAEQTYKLLENLLTWSQTQTKTTNYFPSKIDLEKIINESIDLQEASLKTKNIKINLEINSKTKAFADTNLVKTIVRNLLNNAIKFSNNNTTITINIEEKNNMINISITDQGIGIKPDDVDKIFNIDTDTRKIGTSKEKGTGLGLMICKEFVQINKGKIWVHSLFGKGSSFGFSLPLS